MPNLKIVATNLWQHPHSFRLLTGLVLQKLGVSSWLRIERDGYFLRFYRTALGLSIWADPAVLSTDAEFFKSRLKPGDLVIDAGANIGDLTLLAARLVGPTGSVVAVEAHPETARYLRQNVHENGARNVQLFNVALGAAPGTAHFTSIRDDSSNSIDETGGGLKVPVVRLDDLPIRAGRVALLKLDVEGYEKFVIDGASRILDRTDCVYFEAWKPLCERFGYQFSDVRERLERHGFTICHPDGEKIAPGYDASVYSNLTAVR